MKNNKKKNSTDVKNPRKEEKNKKDNIKLIKKNDKNEIPKERQETLEKVKNINNPRKILLILAIVILIVYSIYAVCNLVKKPTDVFMVRTGNLSEEETLNGYVVREENVIESESNKNEIVKIKAEGEKTAKGDSVFRYTSSVEKDIEKKISELDEKIQEVMTAEDTNFPTDKKLIETQIENELNNLYGNNELQNIKSYKKNINMYITKKAKIAGELSPAGSYLKSLIAERTEYEKQLNSTSEYINSPVSGMVSYKVDGLEKVLTASNLNNLNKEFLEKLNLKIGQVVASSENSAKIINNYNSYIIFNSNSEEAKKIKVGNKIKIRIQNTIEVSASIENIIEESDGSRTIAIKIQNYVEKLISYRKISLDVIWWSATGFKIPNSAIKTIDNITYIIRNRNGYLDKMAVKILKRGQDYSIVKSYTRSELLELGLSSEEISKLKTLTVYDEILLEPTEKQLLQ